MHDSIVLEMKIAFTVAVDPKRHASASVSTNLVPKTVIATLPLSATDLGEMSRADITLS
jgi:hypothetical protein